ncbi:hypothetical protein CSC2_30790 [Clostridium zeae]|uniref:Uncharacterized protein n=1 Tax=Clostridium zeae TaxID=2759022 RepID=A0ABQ1EDE3_9CLOT|nr:hypothetical protein [Clostridium zeae]GFZ32553.1 hypothetical protein CSC2_30790 [Clostridium zeae]
MNSKHRREYTEKNFKKNGTKTQNQWAKSRFPTTIEEPSKNKSGVMAEEQGWT